MKTELLKQYETELSNFDLENLDILSEWHYNHFIKGMTKVESLKVLINMVEGDFTQLEDELSEIAEKYWYQIYETV